MRTPLAVLAALAVALTCQPGHAATKKPQIVDAKNDAIGGQAQTEIVSALWTTSGETYKAGRKTVYVPKRLVVTLNLAGAPSTTAPFSYETAAEFGGCGTVRFVYTPGTVYSQLISNTFLWYDCGPGDQFSGPGLTLVPNVTTKLGAKSITWEYPIKALGKAVKPGTPVTDFTAAVHVVEPVLGISGTTDLGTPVDGAESSVVWRLGS